MGSIFAPRPTGDGFEHDESTLNALSGPNSAVLAH